MGITKEQFLALSVVDRVVDGHGSVWKVLANVPTESCSDVPGPREIVLRCGDTTLAFGWSDSKNCIVDEEYAIWPQLSHPDARIE